MSRLMASKFVGHVSRISGMYIKLTAVFIRWQGCSNVRHVTKSSPTCYLPFTSCCTSGRICVLSNFPTTVQCRFEGWVSCIRKGVLNDSLTWKLYLIDRSLRKHRSMVLTRYYGTVFSAITVCKTMALSSLKWSNSLCCWEINFNMTTGAWRVWEMLSTGFYDM